MRGQKSPDQIGATGIVEYVDVVYRCAFDGERFCQFSNTGGVSYRDLALGSGELVFPPQMFGITYRYNSRDNLNDLLKRLETAKSSRCLGRESLADGLAWHLVFDLGPNRTVSHYWIEGEKPFRVFRIEHIGQHSRRLVTASYDDAITNSPLPKRVQSSFWDGAGRLREETNVTAKRLDLDWPVDAGVGTIASLGLPVGITVSDEIQRKILGYWDGSKISNDVAIANNPRSDLIPIEEGQSTGHSTSTKWRWSLVAGVFVVAAGLIVAVFRSRRRPDSNSKMSASSPRPAATLLETLVAMAILGVGSALFFSGVQAVRNAAQRTACANNLRQVAVALLAFHDAHSMFPSGCSYLNGRSDQPHMSWLTRLLPHMENDALWQKAVSAFQRDRFFESKPHLEILGRFMPIFTCPGDPSSIQPKDWGPFTAAFTNYLGVEGQDLHQQDGILYLDSQVRLSGVLDGTSNTVMIGERPPSADGALGWWYAGWGQLRSGSAEMILGVRELRVHPAYRECPPGPYRFEVGRLSDSCSAFHFWSLHPHGSNFAFCDGSVRFLAYSADSLMPALASRAGGEAVTLPD